MPRAGPAMGGRIFMRIRRQSKICSLLSWRLLLVLTSISAGVLQPVLGSLLAETTLNAVVDHSCNISIVPMDHRTNRSRAPESSEGSDVVATCSSPLANPALVNQAVVPTTMPKSSHDAGIHSAVIGYALPMTLAPHDSHHASVFVGNPGTREVHVRGEIREWHQDAFGQDVMVASPTASISPKSRAIQPGAAGEFHIELPAAANHELAFRILLQQLWGESDSQGSRNISTITQSLPAFSEPVQFTEPMLLAHRIDPQHLLVKNNGGRHERIIAIKHNSQIIASGLVAYALAHAAVLIVLNNPVYGSTVELETDRGLRVVPIQ